MRHTMLLIIGLVGCLALALGFFLMFNGPTAGADFEAHRLVCLSLMISGFGLLFLSAFTLNRRSLGDRIIEALKTQLDDYLEASDAGNIVRWTMAREGANNPNLVQLVLDDLHRDMPYPTEACAVVRGFAKKAGLAYA